MQSPEIRIPILPRPSRTIWTLEAKRVLITRLLLILIFIIGFFSSCTITTISIVNNWNARMTATVNAFSTLSKAQTLTAIPTSTPTLTPTVTLTPTNTHTPTITPSLTPTPVFAWKSTIPDDSTETGPFLSLKRSKKGELVLAYFLDKADDLKVIRQSGGSWRTVNGLAKLNDEGTNVGFHISMDLDTDGNPFLFYWILDKKALRLAFQANDGTWGTSTIKQAINVYGTNIVVDTKSIYHVVYLSKSGEITYQAGNAAPVKIDSNLKLANAASINFNYIPIAITSLDGVGTPCICYAKADQLLCSQKSKSSWQITTVADNGIHPTLFSDNQGGLHLAYYDLKQKALKYAFSADKAVSWNIYTVDSTANVGIYPSITVGTNGIVHISYYDFDNRRLKYATGQFGGWSITIPDASRNDTGLISSIVLDDKGNPVIAYYDNSIRRVKLIFGTKK